MMKSQKDPDQVELESQFILRLPEEPAKTLREIIQSGSSDLKERLSIKLENDVRYGEVTLDNWYMPAKVVDLPTIIESLKTIDCKAFYKTADICQMMICKEENDEPTTDEESPTKHKKKDPNKVDKKFLYPHGVTPPLKNVRKRRFRKTLRKKFVEAPEIEKEVKRLLRGDCDAVTVRWEVINEDEDKKENIVLKDETQTTNGDTQIESTQQSVDVAEDDIFGEPVSDSDEEGANLMEIEETSRLSPDDSRSRISDSTSLHGAGVRDASNSGLVTQFSREMFDVKEEEYIINSDLDDHSMSIYKKFDIGDSMSQDEIRGRLEQLHREIQELRVSRDQQQMEIDNIENPTLKQRFQDELDSLLQKMLEKEQLYQELSENL